MTGPHPNDAWNSWGMPRHAFVPGTAKRNGEVVCSLEGVGVWCGLPVRDHPEQPTFTLEPTAPDADTLAAILREHDAAQNARNWNWRTYAADLLADGRLDIRLTTTQDGERP